MCFRSAVWHSLSILTAFLISKGQWEWQSPKCSHSVRGYVMSMWWRVMVRVDHVWAGFTSYGSFKLETEEVILFVNFQRVCDYQESGAGGFGANGVKQIGWSNFFVPKAFITPDIEHFPSGATNIPGSSLKSTLYRCMSQQAWLIKCTGFSPSFAPKNTRYAHSVCTARWGLGLGHILQIMFESQDLAKAIWKVPRSFVKTES